MLASLIAAAQRYCEDYQHRTYGNHEILPIAKENLSFAVGIIAHFDIVINHKRIAAKLTVLHFVTEDIAAIGGLHTIQLCPQYA